jgi:hypothetical protein
MRSPVPKKYRILKKKIQGFLQSEENGNLPWLLFRKLLQGNGLKLVRTEEIEWE